ncbi:MAG: hypothetical protein ACP5OX_01320 [Minisyncoccia bacterium]
MENYYYKLDRKKEYSLKESGLPLSMNQFLETLLDKIDLIKEAKPFDTHIPYTQEFIKDLNRFLSDIKEYYSSVRNFEATIKQLSPGIMEPGEKARYENILEQEELRRKILHDSVIKNFFRLILSYKNTFDFLATLPSDSYMTEEKREMFKKEKFPWKCNIILNENGDIQEKFLDKNGNIDLSFLTNEDREIFSQWALNFSKELLEAEKEPNVEGEEEDNKIVNTRFNLKRLEEELKLINKFQKTKKKENEDIS